MKTNYIVTVLHPFSTPYFRKFVLSVADQTVRDFRLLIFYDQVEDPEHSFTNDLQHIKHEFIELGNRSITANRVFVLNYLAGLEEGYIHFGDSDDFFEPTRIASAISYLPQYSIVCHDFNLVDREGKLLDKDHWSKRLANEFVFGYDYLKDKNLLGFGNISIDSSIFKDIEIKLVESPAIPDWFIFNQIVSVTKARCIFIATGQVNYRQHDNLAQFTENDFGAICNKLDMVLLHHESLLTLYIDAQYYRDRKTKLTRLKNHLTEKYLNEFLAQADAKNYFWWEIIADLLNYYESTTN
ncbi:MAG: hypothetical protein AAF363_14210 [Bacteroidota bacterium]